MRDTRTKLKLAVEPEVDVEVELVDRHNAGVRREMRIARQIDLQPAKVRRAAVGGRRED